jgi:hypothetical protein
VEKIMDMAISPNGNYVVVMLSNKTLSNPDRGIIYGTTMPLLAIPISPWYRDRTSMSTMSIVMTPMLG